MMATVVFVIVGYTVHIPLQLIAQGDKHPVSDHIHLTFFALPHSAEIRYNHLP
jgi:hypothetical protein